MNTSTQLHAARAGQADSIFPFKTTLNVDKQDESIRQKHFEIFSFGVSTCSTLTPPDAAGGGGVAECREFSKHTPGLHVVCSL